MTRDAIRSEAFWQATLRSERLRILSVIIVAALALGFGLVRAAFFGNANERALIAPICLVVLGLIGYEFLMLAVVSRAVHRCCEPPAAFVWFNVAVEALFPTAVMFFLTRSAFAGPIRAVTGPIILVYTFLIVLSILRLSPLLCLVTGMLAGSAHAGLVTYVFSSGDASAVLPRNGNLAWYYTYGAFFTIAGIAAALVARQVRAHVIAALNEAAARQRVEQMEHDLDIARSIQEGLLPRETPRIDGFEIAGWSQPADQTGGDYYDWQQLPDGRVVASLADVTGHGIGPALVTAVCRAYARASFTSGGELGALMQHINDLLIQDLPDDRFITFVVALVDPNTHGVKLLSAGHGPILLYQHARRAVDAFNAHDIPFGVAPGVKYGPEQELLLQAGDVLVLITDGFFEWRNAASEQFGIERLKQVLMDAHARPAREIISRFHEAVRDFAGGSPQDDDLTAVVLKRT